MKVFVKGSGEVTLSATDFVAEGGQAAVYQKNGTAYKVYTEPQDSMPEAKLIELEGIADPCVIRPEKLLVDPKRQTPLGYTMRFLSGTLTLCQIFPRVFRERRGLGDARVRELVRSLRTHIEHVHQASIVIVDLNELNVLVSDALDEVFLIDVDSYQTRSFPAEVIMPSVRDYTVEPKDFGPLSDWFSFAVLAFQMYVGVHPYKGSHRTTDGLHPEKRLEARMRAHLSAFNKDTVLPRASYPLTVIPSLERAWMRAVLEEGKRFPPPDASGQVPEVTHRPQADKPIVGGAVEIALVRELLRGIVAYASSGKEEVLLADDGALYHGQALGMTIAQEMAGSTVLVGITPKLGREVALVLRKDKRVLLVEPGTSHVIELAMRADEIAKAGGRFVVRVRDRIFELDIFESHEAPLAASATHPVAQVLEAGTRLFEGVAIQKILGGLTFVSVFASPRRGYQVRMPELDPYRIVDAKFEGGVLMVLGAEGGEYERLVFRFDETLQSYDKRVVTSTSGYGLNFIVTERGVCVCLTEDERLEVFLAAKETTSSVRVVEAPALSGDMRLSHVRGGVGFVKGNAVYSMRLK